MNFLFRQIDISSLVFFRVVFGILAFADVLGSWIGYVLIEDAYNSEKLHFPYYGFEWVKVLPEPFLTLFFFSLMVAAWFIVFGKWYRVMTTYFAFGFLYFFLMEKSNYLNHGYLFCMLSFIMILLPANRKFSFDVIKKPMIRLQTVEYWNIFILQFMMGIVYFFGGIAKLNKDWLNGMPLKYWVGNRKDMLILGWLWEQEWVAYFMSYGGLLLDLTVVFFLINKKTRWRALLFILFFHLVNMTLFMIGIFPFLSVALTLLFFEPDFPIKTWNWLKEKFSFPKKIETWRLNFLEKKNYQSFPKKQKQVSSFSKKKIIISCLVIFCSLQMLIPLRHHYFKGDVAWTEEGHRYSWRMMLRSKQGRGYFIVKGKTSNEEIRINPLDYMNRRQRRKMYTLPDMILQFSHFLEKKFEAELEEEVEIYAHIKVRLNRRPYSNYVNPEVDLTKVKWEFFKSSTWLAPYPKGDPK